MQRIVPPDVESGDEWGSEAEQTARDVGHFKRVSSAAAAAAAAAVSVADADGDADAEADAKPFPNEGPPSPPTPASNAAQRTARRLSVTGAGRGGAMLKGRGAKGGVGGGAVKGGVVGGRGPNKSVPSNAAADETPEQGLGESPAAAQGVAGGPKLAKKDVELLERYGVFRPKGKHPGHISTLYGRKVRRSFPLERASLRRRAGPQVIVYPKSQRLEE